MLRKIQISALALVLVAGSTAWGQKLANIVGYVNKTIPAGTVGNPSLTCLSNPLDARAAMGDNYVVTILGQLTTNASVLTWNGTDYDENVYYAGSGWTNSWDRPMDELPPGKAFFIKNTGASFSIRFCGEIRAPRDITVTNQVQTAVNSITAVQYSFIGPKVPVAGDLQFNDYLNLTNAVANDSVLQWDGSGWNENSYSGSGIWDTYPDGPMVDAAEGFFYKQAGTYHTINWTTVNPVP